MTGPMIPRERCDLFRHRRPPAAEAAGRRAHRDLDHRQSRGLGHRQADGAAGAARRRPAMPLLPDVPNWSWHEYGMRVGVWRFFELYERLGIRPTLSINARVCEDYPRVAQAGQAMPAGSSWAMPMSRGRSTRSADQKAMIAPLDGRHREVHRQAAGRLARTGPDPDARDARTTRRGRRQIYRRLGL